MLPTAYLLAFILFLILGVIWALTLSKKRAMALRVHYFMASGVEVQTNDTHAGTDQDNECVLVV